MEETTLEGYRTEPIGNRFVRTTFRGVSVISDRDQYILLDLLCPNHEEWLASPAGKETMAITGLPKEQLSYLVADDDLAACGTYYHPRVAVCIGYGTSTVLGMTLDAIVHHVQNGLEPLMSRLQLTLSRRYRHLINGERYHQIHCYLARDDLEEEDLCRIWQFLANASGDGLGNELLPLVRWFLSGEFPITENMSSSIKPFVSLLSEAGYWDDVLVVARLMDQFPTSKLWCKCIVRAIQQDRLEIVHSLLAMVEGRLLMYNEGRRLTEILRSRYPGEVPWSYLMLLIPLYRNPAVMIYDTSPIAMLEYMHQRNLISDSMWSHILAGGLERRPLIRFRQLWQILLADIAEGNSPGKHEMKILCRAMVKQDQIHLENMVEIITEMPSLLDWNDHAFFQRIIRLINLDNAEDAEILATNEQVRQLVAIILRDYSIDLTVNNFRILRKCHDPETIQMLSEYVCDRDLIYQGSRVHYHGLDDIKIIGCEQELPIYGWNTILFGGHYLYSNTIRIDAKQGQFIAIWDSNEPLPILENTEPIEVWFGVAYQERIVVTPCAIVEQYRRSLLASRSKSARSAMIELD